MSDVAEAIAVLRSRGIVLDAGLTQREIEATERRYEFVFADQHAQLLRTALPIGRGWPDWRRDSAVTLTARLFGPIDGVLFDVEQNEFWRPSWGVRPADTAEALQHACDALQAWPQLVPLYSHRFLLAGPEGPVLSVHQTDVIIYGLDIIDYIHQEFGSRKTIAFPEAWRPPAALGPWRDLLE